MSSLAEIEDKLMETIKGLDLFRAVVSAGRQKLPEARAFPWAFVFFVSERDMGVKSRPVVEIEYEVVVAARNLSGEDAAARDAYALLDAARDAVNGKSFGLTDIEPFTCASREMSDYEAGVITYALRFRTRHYLPAVTE